MSFRNSHNLASKKLFNFNHKKNMYKERRSDGQSTLNSFYKNVYYSKNNNIVA